LFQGDIGKIEVFIILKVTGEGRRKNKSESLSNIFLFGKIVFPKRLKEPF